MSISQFRASAVISVRCRWRRLFLCECMRLAGGTVSTWICCSTRVNITFSSPNLCLSSGQVKWLLNVKSVLRVSSCTVQVQKCLTLKRMHVTIVLIKLKTHTFCHLYCNKVICSCWRPLCMLTIVDFLKWCNPFFTCMDVSAGFCLQPLGLGIVYNMCSNSLPFLFNFWEFYCFFKYKFLPAQRERQTNED